MIKKHVRKWKEKKIMTISIFYLDLGLNQEALELASIENWVCWLKTGTSGTVNSNVDLPKFYFFKVFLIANTSA